jgi:hypothetical protein
MKLRRWLNELLFPSRPVHLPHQLRATVDFAEIHRQLKGHQHVTLRLLWEEYPTERWQAENSLGQSLTLQTRQM